MYKYPHTTFFFATLFVASFLSVFLGSKLPLLYEKGTDMLAAVFFTPSITVPELKAAYNGTHPTHRTLKILIVPGHEPFTGGTEYGGVTERNLTVLLANDLRDILGKNKKYEVFVTRNQLSWHEPLVSYFKNQGEAIDSWRREKQLSMNALVASGTVTLSIPIVHGKANSDDARRLYGVQKWANEQDYDVILHIHINDYPRKGKEKKYTGLALYVPEHQYSNADASQTLAAYMFKELNTVIGTSTLKEEKSGVVEDQELIAIGRFNTADTANVLIEYGYIYEPQYQGTNEVRDQALYTYALKTYQGLEDFFGDTKN